MHHCYYCYVTIIIINMTYKSFPISPASSKQLRCQASLLPHDKRAIHSRLYADHLWKIRLFFSKYSPLVGELYTHLLGFAQGHEWVRLALADGMLAGWCSWVCPWVSAITMKKTSSGQSTGSRRLRVTWVRPEWGQAQASPSELSRAALANHWVTENCLFVCYTAKANCSHSLTSFPFPFL